MDAIDRYRVLNLITPDTICVDESVSRWRDFENTPLFLDYLVTRR